MTESVFNKATNRSCIKISGLDSLKFLNSLLSNDVSKVSSHRGIYALLLSPQGKFLYDMFVIMNLQGEYLLDVSASSKLDVIKKLSLYKLRSNIMIEEDKNILIFIQKYDSDKHEISPGVVRYSNEMYVMSDPRLVDLGTRIYCNKLKIHALQTYTQTQLLDANEYNLLRLELGVPEGEQELVNNKSYPLNFSLDKLNAIDYNKGCYVGQEVTARTTYRGVVRKNIYLVRSTFNISRDEIISYNDTEIGRVVSSCDQNYGIALINEEEYQKFNTNKATILGVEVKLEKPKWR